MDRLLTALANSSQRAIVDHLLASSADLGPLGLRRGMSWPEKDRAQFGRHLEKLIDVGVLEQGNRGEVRLADRDVVEGFLQAAANTQAALDARRAALSAREARARAERTVRQRTADASKKSSDEVS